MRGAGGYGRDASRLAAAKRRLLRAAALGALASSGGLTGANSAWGQVAATLPEVTVAAPRPAPVRRAAPAAKPARAARPARVAAPAPSPASAQIGRASCRESGVVWAGGGRLETAE